VLAVARRGLRKCSQTSGHAHARRVRPQCGSRIDYDHDTTVERLPVRSVRCHWISVTVADQIVPSDTGAHAAVDSNFVLLDFDEPRLSPVVYVEGLAAYQNLERKEDVDRYREAIDYLPEAALSTEDSMQRIAPARNTYESGLNAPPPPPENTERLIHARIPLR
jgi:hypothetical protein